MKITPLYPSFHLASSRRVTGPPPAAAPGSHEPGIAQAQRVVLIAEDYADTRALYAEHLADAGFRVVEASDGEQAVALALQLRPDAIIMDLSMPKVDGWEATRRIRALPGMADTYLLVLSAMDGEFSRAMAFDAGCNDFIRKPFLGEALAEVVLGYFRARDRSADD